MKISFRGLSNFSCCLISICVFSPVLAQDSSKSKTLNDVVVTGQYAPQSLKSSVYKIRTIGAEKIRLSGAANVQQALNTELGFRFSNDNTLGVSNVFLNGVGGRNVKVLLDGVPLSDRFDERVSLSQVDINSIDHIEIVEGPMSVSYGTDAMAGVINLITKKSKKSLSVAIRAQEESAGDEYYPFGYEGHHIQNLAIDRNINKFNIAIGGTHNEFNGFNGDHYGRGKSWLPKEQWFGNGKVGYANEKFNIYYRFDGLQEELKDRKVINIDLDALYAKSTDKYYVSDRLLHQIQGGYRFNNNLNLSGFIAYTDLQRKTETFNNDFIAATSELSIDEGSQDISKLQSISFKSTLQYIITPKVSVQPGVDVNYEKGSGDRIVGQPSINDYAFFASAELKPTTKLNLRPGVRFQENSKYDAPFAIPSFNGKLALNKNLDLRASYGYGFRAPVLRELFFVFKDANHDLVGNKDLLAERSNSFNASLSYSVPGLRSMTIVSSVSGFYNAFDNQIELALINGTTQYTYFNINKSKTTGVSLENKLAYKNLTAQLGINYIGSEREFEEGAYKDDARDFLWTPEVNANVVYSFPKIKTSLAVFYKFIGTKPAFSYKTIGTQSGYFVTETDSYHFADATATVRLLKYFSVSAGVKNIFDVTDVRSNTVVTSTSAHSTAGAQALSYGRSYFLGINFQLNK